MFKKLIPNETVQSIYQVDLKALHLRGLRNIILDLDNTITPWKQDVITDPLRKWVFDARQMGFKICLFSNSSYKRVSAYAEKLGVLAAPVGGKPLLRAFKSALAVLDAKSSDTAIIGDQIFTDIWGGNRMGLYTILVEPISKREFFGTKLARLMEKLIAKRR